MKLISSLLLGAAVAAGTLAPAAASVSSRASTGPLTVILYDLDLTDGITPSISFLNTNMNTLIAVMDTPSLHDHTVQWGAGAFTNASRSDARDGLFIESAIVGDGTLAGLKSLSASGSASALNADDSSSYLSGAVVPPYYLSPNFTLSAHTMAVFQTTADVQAITTLGTGPRPDRFEVAVGEVELRVFGGSWVDDTDPTLNVDRLAVNAVSGLPETLSDSKLLSVSFTNNLATDKAASFYLTTQAYGGVNMIPEPSTVLMLGVGVMVLLARRRLEANGPFGPLC
jgi:hypothetical protein